MLTTERLRLEHLNVRHAPDVLAYNERNRDYLAPWEPAPPPDFFTEAYHETDIRNTADVAYCARFAVFERTGDVLIGMFNLWDIKRGVNQSAIIGYSVDQHFAGRGYASEAVAAIVDYAFDVLKLHRLETTYQPINAASGRVLRNNGFLVEGYARDYLFINNAWRDAIFVSRTNPAYSMP